MELKQTRRLSSIPDRGILLIVPYGIETYIWSAVVGLYPAF